MEQTFYIRKLGNKWHILKSPDGKYPSSGYIKKDTGCETKEELLDLLKIQNPEYKIILISI